MEKNILLRHSLFFTILGLLAFPVVHLSLQLSFSTLVWDPFVLKVLQGALIQSVLSTLLTVCLGTLGALGLASLKKRMGPSVFRTLQFVIVIPSFLPPIIVVSLATTALKILPVGLLGVVFFHTIMNVGLMSLLIFRYLESASGSWVRFARVSNVSLLKFIARGLLPEMKHRWIWWSFYFFILYFFSFSIPFLVGGTEYGGIEVFVYEKVLFLGQWAEAIQYCMILFVILLLLSYFLKDSGNVSFEETHADNHAMSYLSLPIGVVCLLSPVIFLVFGLIASVPIVAYQSLEGHWDEIRGTLVVGLSVGLLVFFFLSLLTFSYVTGRAEKWLLAFVHPGWVFIGFSFLLIGGEGVGWDFSKIIISLVIVYLPFVYRLSFHSQLKILKQQVKVTQSFNCGWWKVYSEILWPQCVPSISLLSGIAGLWACGDFALTGLLSQTSLTSTLALEMKTLLANYRMEQAIQLLWPLLISSSVVFFVFQGFAYVSSRKTIS